MYSYSTYTLKFFFNHFTFDIYNYKKKKQMTILFFINIKNFLKNNTV